MAVDIVRQCQVACKIVKLHEPPQKRSGRVSFSGPQWREVDLLKDISHVRREILLLTLAYRTFSQISYTSSVSSSPRKCCMTIYSISGF